MNRNNRPLIIGTMTDWRGFMPHATFLNRRRIEAEWR